MTNIEEARAYIQTAPLAVSGQGGDKTTFKVACRLVRDFALPGDEALKIMGDYNTRLDEQWTRQELKHKIESALKSSPRFPRSSVPTRVGPYKPTPPAPPANVTTWKINPKPLPVAK